jgi:hypothetical protein
MSSSSDSRTDTSSSTTKTRDMTFWVARTSIARGALDTFIALNPTLGRSVLVVAAVRMCVASPWIV